MRQDAEISGKHAHNTRPFASRPRGDMTRQIDPICTPQLRNFRQSHAAPNEASLRQEVRPGFLIAF
jgi:hypothetical protein